MEDMAELMEDMRDYLDEVYEHHDAFNKWIQTATESILKLQEEVNYLKYKKSCI